jgi:predicted MFS family arabinose efflux permease
LCDKLGHRRLVALAMIAMGLLWLGFGLGQAWWNDRAFASALFFVEPLTQSVMVVSLWTLCMDNSVPRTAATQFAAYTSLLNLSNFFGQRFVAGAVEAVDFRVIYLAAGAFQIALVAFLPFIDPHQVRRELVDGSEPER